MGKDKTGLGNSGQPGGQKKIFGMERQMFKKD